MAARTTGYASWNVTITQQTPQTATVNATGGPLAASAQQTIVIEPSFANLVFTHQFPAVVARGVIFTINSTINNTGNLGTDTTNATLNFPFNSFRFEKDMPSKLLGFIAAGTGTNVSWQVRAENEGTWALNIAVNSTKEYATSSTVITVLD